MSAERTVLPKTVALSEQQHERLANSLEKFDARRSFPAPLNRDQTEGFEFG